MSSYIFTITDAGIVAANTASTVGPRINITQFKLGSGVNYTPQTSDTALHGSVLHTGAIFDYRIDSNNQVTYLMRVDATVGTFSFGEVGLYTDTGTLFALSSLTILQEKVAAGVGTPGNVITLEARCIISNVAAAIAFPIASIVNSQIPEIADVSNLPLASDTNQSNAFSIQSGDENANACLAIRNSSLQTWAFSTHTGMSIESTVTTSTTTQVSDAAIGTLLSGNYSTRRYIIEFTTGALKSICRYITSSTNGVVNFAALGSAPVTGVGYRIWRSNVSLPPNVALGSTTPAAEGVASTATPGASSDAARADHRHAMPDVATASVSGFMSAAAMTKLDAIDAGATNTPLSAVAPAAETVGVTAVIGVSTSAARADHRHALPGLATTSTDGFMSAADKVKVDASTGLALSAVAPAALGAAAAVGVGTVAARSDHVHILPSAAQIGSVIGTPSGITKGNGAGSLSAATNADAAALMAVNGLLKSNGSTTVSAAVAATDYVSPSVATTFSASQTFVGMQETRVAVAAGSFALASGTYFIKTFVAGAITMSVAGTPVAGIVASFIFDMTNAGLATITWMTGTKWALGVAPTFTSAGRDILGFYTHDGGTTWVGLVLGKDVK